eukprot:2501029-Amphidinium_carterae.1
MDDTQGNYRNTIIHQAILGIIVHDYLADTANPQLAFWPPVESAMPHLVFVGHVSPSHKMCSNHPAQTHALRNSHVYFACLLQYYGKRCA